MMAQNTAKLIEIQWQVRQNPLLPTAVAARGNKSKVLAKRLLEFSDETLTLFRGVAGKELLIVLGDEANLPWIDGVEYLGFDNRAPALLLPTIFEPVLPLPLIEKAILAQTKMIPPISVFIEPVALASIVAARPVLRQSLIKWLE